MAESTAQKFSTDHAERFWFVAREDVLKGPFSSEELQAKVKSKEISYLDYCWRQGFKEWRPVGSVSEFDRRGRLRALPSYPNIDVPGGGAAKSSGTPAPQFVERRKKSIEVRLNRASRFSITIYEWAGALVFALVLSFLSVNFALNEVQDAATTHRELSEAGRLEDFAGPEFEADSTPSNAEVWAPVFGAPGYKEYFSSTASLNRTLPQTTNMKWGMDLEVNGYLKPERDGGLSVSGVLVLNPFGFVVPWNTQTEMLDPVYIRPARIRGQLEPLAPRGLKPYFFGEPHI